MPAVDLSIVGRMVNGTGEPDRGEILVAGGRIVEVRTGEPARGRATTLIDVGDAYLLPGAIDCHVHSGSHPGEGIRALTASAAAGGVTTVIDMPYDAGAPVVNPEVLAAKRAQSQRRGPGRRGPARHGAPRIRWRRRRPARRGRRRRIQALPLRHRPASLPSHPRRPVPRGPRGHPA